MRRTAPTTDAARITELFARPEPAYTSAEVVRLLGVSEDQLQDAIAKGAITTEENDAGEIVIAWDDVALLALDEWTPRMIEAALRPTATDVIPLLNQHRLVRVSLPIYLLRLLDHQARFASGTRHVPRNASDIIEQVLHDWANTLSSASINEEITGFAEALAYPTCTPRTGRNHPRCRYCGTVISQTGCEVCQSCKARHEPNEHQGEYGLPELEEEDDRDGPTSKNP